MSIFVDTAIQIDSYSAQRCTSLPTRYDSLVLIRELKSVTRHISFTSPSKFYDVDYRWHTPADSALHRVARYSLASVLGSNRSQSNLAPHRRPLRCTLPPCRTMKILVTVRAK